MKNTISDISHQLKNTAGSTFNIYNGLLQDEDIEVSSVKKNLRVCLSRNLTASKYWCKTCSRLQRLDAGAIVLEKTTENVADMMRDIELHFAYRARQEKKRIIMSGSDHLSLFL